MTFTEYFDSFARRVELRGELVARTAFRVGAGKSTGDVGAADLCILRDARGTPIIPGSSLKGVLRSAVESVLRATSGGDPDKRFACDPLLDPCVPDQRREDEGGPEDSPRERAEQRRAAMKKLCLTCATFGAPGLMSHVSFRDARPIDLAPVERRDGVAIDRDLGRVSGSRKYDFEVVSAGSRFGLVVSIDSESRIPDGMLSLGLDLLGQGFARVGGGTSRGLGWLEPEALQVRVITTADLIAGRESTQLAFAEFQRLGREALSQALGKGA